MNARDFDAAKRPCYLGFWLTLAKVLNLRCAWTLAEVRRNKERMGKETSIFKSCAFSGVCFRGLCPLHDGSTGQIRGVDPGFWWGGSRVFKPEGGP